MPPNGTSSDTRRGDCLDERIAADKEYAKYMEEMIENQRDHEASHMPWML